MIKLLALDIDGVLTDGRVYLAEGGRESKVLHYQDVDALNKFRRLGGRIALVTGESSPLVETIVSRLGGCDWLLKGAKEKLKGLEELSRLSGVPLGEICYVGDADRDAEGLERAGLSFAPADASPAAKRAATRVLEKAGGRGCVKEAVERLLGRVEKAAAEHPGGEALIDRFFSERVRLLDRVRRSLGAEIASTAATLADCLRSGGKILIAGEGASAAEAALWAKAVVGKLGVEGRPLPAIALASEGSAAKAPSCNCGFTDGVRRQIESLGEAGDVFIAVAAGGNSEGLAAAVQQALGQGLRGVALTGEGGERLGPLVPCLQIPHAEAAGIRELQWIVMHVICDLMEAMLDGDVKGK